MIWCTKNMELNPILNLDIGGKRFRVLRSTVMKYPNSLLARVITGKDTEHMMIFDGAYFFDRNPQYFSVILDFMRIGSLFFPTGLVRAQLIEELKFWQLNSYVLNIIDPKIDVNEIDQPTLIIPEYLEPTLLAQENMEPTILIPSPKIEPTLLLADPPLLNIEVKETISVEFSEINTESNKLKESFRSKSGVINESKFKIDEEDDLLTSLVQRQPKKVQTRTLPWSKSSESIKPNEETKKETKSETKKETKKPTNKGTKKSNEDKYEASFIEDDQSDSSKEFIPQKRKANLTSEPKKQLNRPNASTRCKKSNLVSEEELLKALNNSHN